MKPRPVDFAGFTAPERAVIDYAQSADPDAPVPSSSANASWVEFGRPVIFGEPNRPHAGRLHETNGRVLGAVVMCNPWGYEENCSNATFQLLARRLALSGIEVLRFDYEGCGNSWGDSSEPQQFSRWLAGCGQALTFMSARTGHSVGVIGLRLGAALAALISATHPTAACVLWDPIVSGRRYLRAIRAVSMMGVKASPAPTEPGSLVTIGHYLNAQAVSDLERLDLQKLIEAHLGETLIIGRPGAADPKRLASTLAGLGVPTTLEEHAGTDKLLDCAAEQSVIPAEIVERIVTWVCAHPSGAAHRPPALPRLATLRAPSGDWIEEHISVGPLGLSGVLTLPRRQRRAGAVVLSNNGVARSIGPARAWVEWARLWATLGIASLRLDISGLGDSARHPGQRTDSQYPVEAIDDFKVAIEVLKQRGLTPVCAVGLCSGAFLSLDAAAASAGMSGVVAINSQLFHLPDVPGSPDRLRRAAPATHAWLQRLLENTRGGRFLGRRLPYPAWRALTLLGIQPSPLAGAAAAAEQARVLLIYGNDNLGLQRLQQRAKGDLAQWRREGRLMIIPGLDHSMFAPLIRDTVEAQVRGFLLDLLPEVPSCTTATTSTQKQLTL